MAMLNNQMVIINLAISGTDLLEVPTIYKAYIRPKFQGISPKHMAEKMVQYLHLLDPEDLPLIGGIMKSPG